LDFIGSWKKNIKLSVKNPLDKNAGSSFPAFYKNKVEKIDPPLQITPIFMMFPKAKPPFFSVFFLHLNAAG